MSAAELRVFRVVLGGALFGWFVNAPGFWANFDDALRSPLRWPGFPPLLVDARVALALYALPLLAALGLGFEWARRPASLLLAGAALGELLHVQTGSDATFLTSFWAGLYLVWLTHRPPADPKDSAGQGLETPRAKGRVDRRAAATHGRALAQAIVGMLFLGAALGKRTPEYESGAAFFDIYFRTNPAWPYPALREALSDEALRSAARLFSLSALAAELVLAAAPLLPARFVLVGVTVAVVTMMSAWTFHLASVLTSVWCLALAAYLFDRELGAKPARSLPSAAPAAARSSPRYGGSARGRSPSQGACWRPHAARGSARVGEAPPT